MSGGGAQCAVHEHLEVAEAQPLVAEARAQTQLAQTRKAVRGLRLPHAQRELPVLLQRCEGLEGAHPAVLVVNGGHAPRGGDGQAQPGCLDHLVLRRDQVAVAKAPGRVLAQDPQGLAVLIALDDPAGHVQRRVRPGQGGAVEPERVVVLGHQRHGHLARDPVERGTVGWLGPVPVAPAIAAQPASGRHVGKRQRHALERLCSRACVLQAHLALGQRPGGKVDVGVVEAGQHAGAAQVDSRRVRFGASADLAPAHRQLAHHRRGRIERADRRVVQNELLRHRGRRVGVTCPACDWRPSSSSASSLATSSRPPTCSARPTSRP